ncbi:hypothetical protein DPX16_5809 [Anabarilius grahami]|uniref:Uncharacterized protein n=1 Tax=Anabarilius grahami TaxID=495550 RepID=A0A3N0YVP9_ANAGA|nr:hypothetical protein DPX16_5809 [Anabarilius grahami]
MLPEPAGSDPLSVEHVALPDLTGHMCEYLRSKRIPRGRRIQKEPTLGYRDRAFCTKCCEILNKASLDLMVFVIEFVQKELDDINKQITSTERQLNSMTTDLDFESLKTSLDSTITKNRQEICKMKLKKFKRDTVDYRDGWVRGYITSNIHNPGDLALHHVLLLNPVPLI